MVCSAAKEIATGASIQCLKLSRYPTETECGNYRELMWIKAASRQAEHQLALKLRISWGDVVSRAIDPFRPLAVALLLLPPAIASAALRQFNCKLTQLESQAGPNFSQAENRSCAAADRSGDDRDT